jgi:hypothetical protein
VVFLEAEAENPYCFHGWVVVEHEPRVNSAHAVSHRVSIFEEEKEAKHLNRNAVAPNTPSVQQQEGHNMKMVVETEQTRYPEDLTDP